MQFCREFCFFFLVKKNKTQRNCLAVKFSLNDVKGSVSIVQVSGSKVCFFPISFRFLQILESFLTCAFVLHIFFSVRFQWQSQLRLSRSVYWRDVGTSSTSTENDWLTGPVMPRSLTNQNKTIIPSANHKQSQYLSQMARPDFPALVADRVLVQVLIGSLL